MTTQTRKPKTVPIRTAPTEAATATGERQAILQILENHLPPYKESPVYQAIQDIMDVVKKRGQ